MKIICVGKLKEQYWREALAEYQKRLSKYTNLEIIELPDESTEDKKVALYKEGDRILKALNQKDFIVTLEIEGKEYDSLTFSKKIDVWLMENSNLTFIIGGSYGLSPEVKQCANERISFSKMTFPHQLFRVLLLEQLYRCYKINHHESYHK